jgi:hypothetical protein
MAVSASSWSRWFWIDVARGADAVVVAGATADADVLGHRDLHVVDVVGVPDGSNIWFAKRRARGSGPSPCPGSGRCGRSSPGKRQPRTIEFSSTGALEIVTERLLDDDSRQAPALEWLRALRSSCWHTVAKDAGGIER